MRSGAIADFRDTVRLRGVWSYLALTEVTQRYRQTVLGPLWNSAYLVGQAIALSIVFGAIFKSPLTSILPYILAGMTAWMLGPVAIIDASALLISSAGTIKNQNLPYLIHVFRVGTRNFLLFLHNVLAFIVIVPFFHHVPLINPIVLPAAIFVCLCCAPYSFILAMLCARYRDFVQLVQNFSPILFFITPVFWATENVTGVRRAIFTYNPFYYLINLIRKPLLGGWPDLNDLLVATGFLVVGWALCLLFLSWLRPRIPFWV